MGLRAEQNRFRRVGVKGAKDMTEGAGFDLSMFTGARVQAGWL